MAATRWLFGVGHSSALFVYLAGYIRGSYIARRVKESCSLGGGVWPCVKLNFSNLFTFVQHVTHMFSVA